MGADMYIKSITEPARERYNPEFLELCRQRDNAKTNEEKEECQKKIWECWDRMLPEDGYFRDSYNKWNLLWQLGLSWWNDVDELLDDKGMLKPKEAEVFREMITSREVSNPPKNIDGAGWGEPMDKVYRYFVGRKTKLLCFLDKTIELGEPIYCSI